MPWISGVTEKDGSGKWRYVLVDDEGRIVLAPSSGTIPVSGPLTDAELRAAAVAISDDGGSLTVDGTVTAVVSPYDYPLEVARGNVSGITSVNKFGAAPDGIQTTPTDVWSRADASATQQIWLAPTAARVHAIVSSSASDDGDPVGVGARTIRVYGLTSWATAEVSEDITLNGATPVNTSNSYVIIHRMKVLTCGASGPNVGVISATAATDNTVTAIIAAGDGQTEMAIYGVPSTQSFYMTRWSCAIAKSTTAYASFELRVNESPNVQTTAYLRKNDITTVATGSNTVDKRFYNPIKFAGPCIIKVQGMANTNDVDAKAAFDGYLVTNE